MIKKRSVSALFLAALLFPFLVFSPSVSADLYYRQNDHGKLSGLSDDDHTQYAILAGRTGGQVLIGGTGAGDDLTFQTTSNGSKGTYFFSELSSNGFLKTSGGTGALSIDTNTYLTSEVDGSVTNEIEVVDEAYSAANFNGGTASAVSQDDFYDLIHTFDTDDDGLPNKIDSTTNGYVKTTGSDGTLSVSTTVDDDDVAFDDADGIWTATTIGAALEELNDVINGGSPNAAAGKVDWSQIVNVPAGFADGTDDESAGSSTKWNAIGDADGNGSVAFAGTEQDITSSLDGGDVLTITNTDADLASDTAILKLAFNDGADANGIYLAMIGDADGSPTNDYLFTQSGFTSLLPVNVPAEAYDATGWNSDAGAPQKDAVRDQFESLSSVYQPLDSDLTTIAGLTATTNNFIVSVSSAWASRTPAQVQATLSIDDLITLSGVSEGAANLGTFTGATISDNGTIKAGMQELETAVEGMVTKALFDAQTILAATSDNVPAALTVSEQTVVGRVTGGNIAALAIDSDLSSVSGSDDTVPSAKAVKAVTDTKDSVTTAGRSLTRTTNDFAADAELYTDTKSIYFENPTSSDDFKSIWVAPSGVTITKISCESDQTVNFDLQIDDGTPAGVNGSDIACTTFATDSSLAGDVTMAAGDRLDLAVASVSGTPTWVSIHWEFTYDD